LKRCKLRCFSALQRAENSSIDLQLAASRPFGTFQCSSASRKFLNREGRRRRNDPADFQCSSASRKFLNAFAPIPEASVCRSFSALQRAENSSIQTASASAITPSSLSVLFSEPKIPQCATLSCSYRCYRKPFSALQRAENSSMGIPIAYSEHLPTFSALQRAENSSITRDKRVVLSDTKFQCSSASRKFLNCLIVYTKSAIARVSVLFSEPKIPQYILWITQIQLLQTVSVLFSEPKIPQL